MSKRFSLIANGESANFILTLALDFDFHVPAHDLDAAHADPLFHHPFLFHAVSGSLFLYGKGEFM